MERCILPTEGYPGAGQEGRNKYGELFEIDTFLCRV